MHLIFNIGYNFENALSLEVLLGPRHFDDAERAAIEDVTNAYYSAGDKVWEKFIDHFHEKPRAGQTHLKIWEAPYKKL